MPELPPLLEARSGVTDPERLVALATHADAKVRGAARNNPKLPLARKKLLELAEHDPLKLDTAQLSWLAHQGPFGQRVAATHPKTMDATLTYLIRQGHGSTVLRSQPHRTEEWMLELADRDRDLLHYLCTNPAVPPSLAQRAKALAGQPLQHEPAEEQAASTPPSRGHAWVAQAQLAKLQQAWRFRPATPPAPAPTPPSPTEELRTKLLRRREALDLTKEDVQLMAGDKRLQRLAARHPLLPVPLLEWLDGLHPNGQARETLLLRLEQHALDPELFARFAREGDWEVRAAVARNAHLPAFLLPYLAADEDWWVRASAAENSTLLPDQLLELAGEADHAVIRENVARHPHSPASCLERLARDGEAAVRLQVARNPSAPPEALNALAGDERYAVREAVAAHPLTPVETVLVLRSDANERVALVAQLKLASLTEERMREALGSRRRNVKLAIASKPHAPAQVLTELARDRNPLIRAQVSLAPQLPELIRESLLEDPDWAVRQVALSANASAGPSALQSLARHDVRVRQGLSRNAATPAPVLEQLSDDALEEVRLSVVLNPASPEGALRRRLPERPLRPVIRQHPLYDRVKPALHDQELREARNPEAAEEVLEALAFSDSPQVRRTVALHPKAATPLLLRLARDELEEVRLSLAQRVSLGQDVQEVLASDTSLPVLQHLVRRDDFQPAVMQVMAQQTNMDEGILIALTQHEAVTPGVLATLGRNASPYVRVAVARHAQTPLTMQVQLASDPQRQVTETLLVNPHCPPEALAVLARQKESRLKVAQHERTSAETLELLAYDPGFATLLRVERWIRRAPDRVRHHRQVQRLLKALRQRSSAQAFRDLNLLAAVIRHPRATPRALQFASRLNHPEIFSAKQDREASRRAAQPPTASSEVPHG